METLAKIFQTDVSLIKYALLIVFVLIWVGVITVSYTHLTLPTIA